MEDQLLANQSDYLEAGIHIATKVKTPGMKKFIYKVREDGLYLLDLKTIDNRIRVAASMIARYEPKEVVITASRIYAIVAAQKFAEIINAQFIKGRVTPGVFTNPNRPDFMEPKLIFISDSRNEKQAVKEASKSNIPIIALSDTDNSTKYIDLIIPANNRGRKSLAFIYFLLAREVLKERGAIKSNDEFKYSVSDFEAKLDTTKIKPQAVQ
ncbi:MAG: 30S ribosomal protein S2 [Candidatus Micrarchaeia archaeon]